MRRSGRGRIEGFLIGFIMMLSLLGAGAWSEPSPQLASQADLPQDHPKLQAVLESLISSTERGALGSLPTPGISRLSVLSRSFLSFQQEGDRIRVIIEALPSADPEALTRQIAEHRGAVERAYGDEIQALVPLSELLSLAELSDVSFIRLPVRPFLMQGSVRSEGLALIGSQSWNEAGFDGRGVKVGIIDSGYKGYRRLMGEELPSQDRIVTRSFRADGDIECADCDFVEQVHGLGVAEIVHDVAPGASLYLTNIDTDLAFRQAIDWMIDQKVDVVNTSLGFPSGCFNEEEGIFAPQLARARRSGITWVAAAGNEADMHWEGKWNDPDGDNLHNYTATDEGNTLDVVLVETESPNGRRAAAFIDVLFSWEAPCGSAPDDYEVVVLKEEGGSLKPLPPWDEQRQEGQLSDWVWSPGVPIKFLFASEEFDVSRVGEVVKYHLAIRKKRPEAPDARFDLIISCPCYQIQYLKRSGSVSIFEPAISPDVITVGAVHHSPSRCPRPLCPDGRLLVYSGRGPTKDGRIKPDLTAPSHVSTTAFGRWTGEEVRGNSGFTGTSASSPHVAGAAALVKQAFPEFTPQQVQGFLEEQAEDAGEPGKDNRYGAGILTLGAPPTQSPPTISGIEPSSGFQGSTLEAVITGTNLKGTTAVTFSGEGVTATIQAGGTDTMLPITLTIAQDAPPGPRTFQVTTPAGTAESGKVTFTVLEAPRLKVEPETLSFQAVLGGPPPQTRSLKVINAGGGTLTWSASADVPWLQLSPTEGTAPSEITVSVSIEGLKMGTHEGHITITAPNAVNSPLIVPVTLTLEAPPGKLIALKFTKIEFVKPEDWQRALKDGCVVYTNVGPKASPLRVTSPDGSVHEYEIPPGDEVIVCGDVVHIDTRIRPPQS